MIADLPKPSNSSRSRSNYISYPFRAEDLAKFPPPSPGALKRRTLDEVEEDHLEEIERIQNRHAEQKKKMEAKQAKEVEKLKLRHEIEVAEAKVKEAKRKLEEFEKAGSGSDWGSNNFSSLCCSIACVLLKKRDSKLSEFYVSFERVAEIYSIDLKSWVCLKQEMKNATWWLFRFWFEVVSSCTRPVESNIFKYFTPQIVPGT